MRMRSLVRVFLLVLCLGGALPALAQDAGKVIDQYVKASGGSGKLSKLQTLSLEGSLTRASDGQTGTVTLDSKAPNRYYMELIAAGQPEILAYNGNSAWRLSANGEAVTLLGQDALQLEAASTLAASHLLSLKKSKIGAAYVGPANVSSRDVVEIELTMPTGVKRQLYFDVSSHLLLKESGALAGVEQTKKRIEEVQKKQTKKDEKEEKAREQGKQEKEDKDEPGIEVFLRACQFVNPRHERFRGQDVLVFDFEGNPEYKPRKMAERVVQQLAGVVWVDEKMHEVARLEAYFVKDVKFGGGLLANLQKGTSFIFEQAFVNNEVWLPTYEEAHVGARFLLVKGIKVNEVTRYSDYQRFHVETLSIIAKPKETADPPDKQRD